MIIVGEYSIIIRNLLLEDLDDVNNLFMQLHNLEMEQRPDFFRIKEKKCDTMRTNFHTHHYLCGHATGHVEDYVKEAISKNVKILGISDHAPVENGLFHRMTESEFFNIYLKEIQEAKEKYKNQIQIYRGLEIEYFYDYDGYKPLLNHLDYLILGAHFYTGYQHDFGSSYAIDTKEKLSAYTKLLVDGMNTGYFKILAHPDLFMTGYPVFDDFCEACSKRIIETAIRNHVVLEYNANGLRRGKRTYIDSTIDYSYPNIHFFKLVSQYPNAKVIVSSDCHSPKDLYDEAMEMALSNLKALGIHPISNIF